MEFQFDFKNKGKGERGKYRLYQKAFKTWNIFSNNSKKYDISLKEYINFKETF